MCHATRLLCHSVRDSLGVGVSTAVCVPCYMFVVPFCEGQPWCGCVHCRVCAMLDMFVVPFCEGQP